MKVLIIDDDPDYTYLLKLNFEKFSHQVFIADNARDGIQLAIDVIPDIILLDVFLPKENGFQVFRDLKIAKLTRNIPTFLLTNLDQESIDYLCLSVTQHQCFHKHNGISDLIKFATSVVEGGQNAESVLA